MERALFRTTATASQKTGLTLVAHERIVDAPPVPADTVTIPLIISSLERNPENGGTPARESMNTNMDAATSGSLLARPFSPETLWLEPSLSMDDSTMNGPILNSTRTHRWKITAITMSSCAAGSAMPEPIAETAASMYPAWATLEYAKTLFGLSLERAARFPHVMVITDITASVPYQNAGPEAGIAMVRRSLNRATNPIAFDAVARTPATMEDVPE